MILCLGEPPGGFCDVGCYCVSSLEVFTFLGYFSLPPALHPGFSGPWRPPSALTLPWLLSVTTFGCYGFEWAFFTRRRFLPYSPSPAFLACFVIRMRAGTPHLGSSSVPALTGLSLPAGAWTWTTHIVVTRPLIYQLRQWATKYRVKIEQLNMFCLFKVIWKDYKNTLNKTWWKVLLKTDSTSHQSLFKEAAAQKEVRCYIN